MQFSELERQFLLLQTVIKKSNYFNALFLFQESRSWSLTSYDLSHFNKYLTLNFFHFQLDEYHDRLEDFPEEDEDINSDDDTNVSSSMSKMALKAMKGRAFKMEVMNF